MSARELAKKLYYIPRATRWTNGIGPQLPEAYKKFWREWRTQPEPVHYRKKEGMFEMDSRTGVVQQIQNIPIPLQHPPEMNQGIWGGEAVVQGFVKKQLKRRRVPKFWIPKLKKSVVYSEILNKYMSVIVTDRTIDLIHLHKGFDHYILKTPACDLKSYLAMRLKRQMLLALVNKTLYEDKPEEREAVYNKYKHYLDSYTKEEIDWYGLTFMDACRKFAKEKREKVKIVPLKVLYRAELLKTLEEQKLAAEKTEDKQ